MSAERRSHLRAPERLVFSLHGDSGVLQVETKNLSASGAYCISEAFVPPMTKLQVSFELPNSRAKSRIACEGVVVRAEPIAGNPDRWRYHLAILFSDLSERDRSLITHFVQQRLSAPPAS